MKIIFSKYLTPYLYQLQEYYTQFNLSNVLPMKSKYSIRMFEYLQSIRSKGYKQTISIDVIKERTESRQYVKYKDFRVRVLEPAIAEINAYTDISVEYKEVKTGKKITDLEVKILSNDGAKAHINRMIALGTFPSRNNGKE